VVDKDLQEAIQNIIEKTEMARRLEENVKVLSLVRSLHSQGRISDEVAQTFLLEFTIDM